MRFISYVCRSSGSIDWGGTSPFTMLVYLTKVGQHTTSNKWGFLGKPSGCISIVIGAPYPNLWGFKPCRLNCTSTIPTANVDFQPMSDVFVPLKLPQNGWYHHFQTSIWFQVPPDTDTASFGCSSGFLPIRGVSGVPRVHCSGGGLSDQVDEGTKRRIAETWPSVVGGDFTIRLPSGKHRKSYWKWPFIIYPWKMVIFHRYVSLPEGGIDGDFTKLIMENHQWF